MIGIELFKKKMPPKTLMLSSFVHFWETCSFSLFQAIYWHIDFLHIMQDLPLKAEVIGFAVVIDVVEVFYVVEVVIFSEVMEVVEWLEAVEAIEIAKVAIVAIVVQIAKVVKVIVVTKVVDVEFQYSF